MSVSQFTILTHNKCTFWNIILENLKIAFENRGNGSLEIRRQLHCSTYSIAFRYCEVCTLQNGSESTYNLSSLLSKGYFQKLALLYLTTTVTWNFAESLCFLSQNCDDKKNISIFPFFNIWRISNWFWNYDSDSSLIRTVGWGISANCHLWAFQAWQKLVKVHQACTKL